MPVPLRWMYPGLLTAIMVGAQDHPLSYECRRAATPMVIDGRLNEAAWAAAPWTPDFVDIEGASKPSPRFSHPRQDTLGRRLPVRRGLNSRSRL